LIALIRANVADNVCPAVLSAAASPRVKHDLIRRVAGRDQDWPELAPAPVAD